MSASSASKPPRSGGLPPSRIPVISPRTSLTSPPPSLATPVVKRNLQSVMERSGGVRYITEELILKIAKSDNVETISKLNLTLSKEGGKKIRYIENLERCRALQSLNLSCNIIEKVEKLDRLSRLRELNLSHNLLTRLDGLEALVSLQTLDVTDNNIAVVPNWLPKRLKALQVFRIGENAIESLLELAKLRTLPNLVQMSVAENPVCRLPHHRLFLIFHLNGLEILDGSRVEEDERSKAKERFEQEEVERLINDNEAREKQIRELEARQGKSETDARVRGERERELHRKQRGYIERISSLERELEAKDHLLKNKSDELTRACHKHYELEQELAFYKIDAKFDSLGQPPPLDPGAEMEGTGESPYIGKGRTAAVRYPALDNLDQKLHEKQQAIDRAQDRLDGLEGELRTTQESVTRASRELERLLRTSSASLSPDGSLLLPPPPQLSETARSELQAALAKKVNTVSQLQSDAELLRCQMEETEDDMRRQQHDVDALRHQLSRLNPSEPLFGELQRNMVDKEQQLSDNNEAYNDLQQQMETLTETIKTEAEGVRELERRLTESRADQNEQMKGELEGVVSGLQDYLTNIRQQSDAQRKKMDELTRDRDVQRRQVDELTRERAVLQKQLAAEKEDMLARVAVLEECLEDERQANDDLQAQLGDRQEEEEAERRLARAEAEVGELKRALQHVRDEADAERAEMEAALRAEQMRVKDDARDDEKEVLLDELDELRTVNDDLQAQLSSQRRHLMSPRQVTNRVRDLVKDLRDGKPVALNTDDLLSRSLGQLAQEFENRTADARTGMTTPSSRSEAEVQVLRSQAEKSGRDRVDSGSQDQSTQAALLLSMIEDSKRTYNEEMGKMKEQIGRLQSALENARSRPSHGVQLQTMLSNVEEEDLDEDADSRLRPGGDPGRAGGAPRQRVFTRRRPKVGPSGDGSTEEEDGGEGKRRPLMPFKRSVYDTLSSDELGMYEELNSELGRLRRQMENVEVANSGKLEEALAHIRELQGEIRRRDEEAEAAVRENERREWEKELTNTFTELDQAQNQILDLQKQLEDKQHELEDGAERTDKSQDTINTQHREIGQLRDILDAQRQEIVRLNELLDRLSGLSPADVNRMELERIQSEISALRANVAAQTQPYLASYPPPQAAANVAPPPPAAPRTSSPAAGQRIPQPTYAVLNPLPSPSPGPYHSVPQPIYSTSPYPPSVPQYVHGVAASPILGYVSPVPPPSMPPEEKTDERRERRRRSSIGSSNGFLCNVPEHHQLEDYLQGLQDKILGMKRRLKEKKRMEHEAELARIRHLREEEEARKEELEEVELSVSRQRAALVRLREEEKTVVDAARHELERIKAEVARSRREMLAEQGREAMEEAELELEAVREQRQMIRDEVSLLGDTLARRKAEIAHLEKQLSTANTELSEVKAEARETIARYDEARLGHERTVQEADELERRSKDALTELARTANDARDLRGEVVELEANKRQLELMLNEIQTVMGKKDSEYQALEARVRQAAESLSKLQNELSATMEQGREKLELIQEEDQILAEKRAELERLRQQTEAERAELEALDRTMGRRRTEDQMISEQLDKKREELAEMTREVDKEAANRQREIRDIQNTLDSLREEKKHLLKTIEDHKSEREEMREDADREQQVLQNITSAISKQKMELKHLLEMIKLEQAELTKVNEQYSERLSSLERAQNGLHEQRNELAEVEAARKRKAAEVERCREAVQAETALLERVEAERRSSEASVEVLAKEKELLTETSRSLDARTTSMKKSLAQLEENSFSAQSRLDKLSSELNGVHASLAQVKNERESAQREADGLAQQTREAKLEMKALQERLHDYEAKCEKTEAEYRQRTRQRDEVHAELRRLAEQSRAAQLAADEASAKAASSRDELQRVQLELSERRAENLETSKTLNRLQRDVELEEARLNRVASSAGVELDKLKTEASRKAEEIDASSLRLQQMKREMETRRLTEERALDLSRRVAELEAEVAANGEEKQQLAEALNRSYKERQALREDCAKERDARESLSRTTDEEAQRLRQQLAESQRELKRLKKRSSGEIRELEKIAQDHCARSNRLTEDLNAARRDYLELRKQVIVFGRILENVSLMSQSELTEKKRRLEETLRVLRRELKPVNGLSHAPITLSPAPSPLNLPFANGHALEELSELQDQRKLLQTHLDTLKDNLNNIRTKSDTPPTLLGVPNTVLSPEPKLVLDPDEEIVKAQIRQRVNEHMDALATEYQRSEDNMTSLRRRLDDLQTVLAQNGSSASPSSPSRDRSPCQDMGMTLMASS